jgi:hypothetical protein
MSESVTYSLVHPLASHSCWTGGKSPDFSRFFPDRSPKRLTISTPLGEARAAGPAGGKRAYHKSEDKMTRIRKRRHDKKSRTSKETKNKKTGQDDRTSARQGVMTNCHIAGLLLRVRRACRPQPRTGRAQPGRHQRRDIDSVVRSPSQGAPRRQTPGRHQRCDSAVRSPPHGAPRHPVRLQNDEVHIVSWTSSSRRSSRCQMIFVTSNYFEPSAGRCRPDFFFVGVSVPMVGCQRKERHPLASHHR